MILERDVEQYLIEIVRRNRGQCLKWVCPGFAGVPDRIVLLPGGRVYFVELKRPTGSLAARQRAWARRLESLGFRCFTIWSKEEVLRFEKEVIA